jgi:signal transduction histidine kinase
MLRLFALLFLACTTSPALCQDLITFNPEQDHERYIWPMCHFYEDKNANLTIDEILAATGSIDFQPAKNVSSTFGFTESAIWIKFKAKAEHGPVYLLIERVSLWKAELYTTDSMRVIKTDHLGANIPFHQKPIRSDYCVVSLDLPPGGAEKTFYLRLQTNTSMFIPIYLCSASALSDKLSSVNLFNGLYVGIICLIILYNLIQYFLQKHTLYVRYLLYAGSLLLYMGLCNTGLGFQYLWPETPALNQHYTVAKCLLGLSMIGFSAAFLNTRQHIPRLHTLLYFFAGGYVVFLVMNMSGYLHVASKYFFWIFLLSSLYLLVIGVISILKGNLNARFYVAGWGTLILSYLIFSLWLNGWIGESFLARRSLIIGSMLEMLFWFSAISDKINLARAAKTEEEKQMRKDISRDFHDHLGNQAARMINYISLLKVRGQIEHNNYDALNNYAQNILEGAKDFVWALDPKNDEIQNVLIHLRDFGEKMFSEKNISFSFFNHLQHPMALPVGYSRQINLIFKEAMTNAFKHSGASAVTLDVSVNTSHIVIRLADDGAGIREEMIRSSERGVSNMFYRARKIGCDLTVAKCKGEKGTCIELAMAQPVRKVSKTAPDKGEIK